MAYVLPVSGDHAAPNRGLAPRTVEKTDDGNKIVKTVTDEIVEEASFVEPPVTKPVKETT